MLKLIGLSLILAASGAVGAGLAGTVRRQQAQTLALIDALLRIRHELQYRLTPLPEIFAALGGSPEPRDRGVLFAPCGAAVLRADVHGRLCLPAGAGADAGVEPVLCGAGDDF